MKEFELITLPYEPTALEPVISAKTLEFHHGKHLQGYVNNLNAAISGSEFENMELIDIVKNAAGGILNNAGQILNHNLYFTQFCKPSEENKIFGHIADAINTRFGSFDSFKKEFVQAGTTLFGSGWVWLSATTDGTLMITQEPNAANPVQKNFRPLLTFDVWEHAYYLDYQNRRADHLNALWQIIDWKVIEQRYTTK
ncbi:MAG: superoxide dismutase [Bacteroidales bacterium]|nr:superoxide dismutase [Bacteroidales bacterium]MBQ7489093.1 superoxide dismutase [Bacteroidales bacterium]